jgi:hypothetical protein
MTIQEALDQYCLARAQRQFHEQVGLANLMVDELIPELIERLAMTMIERNTLHE